MKGRGSDMAKRSFVAGAAILSAAGLLGKFVGMFYRIWLVGLIGTEGAAFYQSPYALYSFLLVLSSAGLPTAISKMVSEQSARGNPAAALVILSKTRRILFFTGLVASILMAALAGPAAAATGDPRSAPGFIALAPAIFFVCLMSAYRGYFQGMEDMAPTALSQIVEQLGKVLFGFGLAIALRPQGVIWGAVGAILGVTISEFLGFACMLVKYLLHRRGQKRPEAPPKPVEKLYSRLFSIAIPITIGASALPIVSIADAALIQNRLQFLGYSVEAASRMYGAFTGMVIPIINMPAVITLAVSMALVPVMSGLQGSGDASGLRRAAGTGLKLSFLFGSAAAVGLGLLAPQIIELLFHGSAGEGEILLGGRLLALLAPAVFFLSVVQVTTGILQGLGKPFQPVITLLLGVALKIILNYVLIGLPGVNVLGAAYSTIACYAAAAFGNLYFVLRSTGLRLGLSAYVLRPALAAGGMALAVWGLGFLGLSTLLTTALSVSVGVLVYGALLLGLGGLSRKDLSFVPGGARLIRLLSSLRIPIR
jgi:stage V sporulation protein B